MRWGSSNGEDHTSETSAVSPFAPVHAPTGDDAGETGTGAAPAVVTEREDAVTRADAPTGDDAVPVPPILPPSRSARAGRNLWLATGVGVTLGVGALLLAWWSALAFAILLYAFCIAAAVEWRSVMARRGIQIALVPVVLATIGMGIATWFGATEGLIVALLVSAAGILAWRVADDRVENTLADSLAGIFTMTWIPFLGSFLLLLERADDGWIRVFIVLLAVVLNDTGALFSGMLFGRHKLAPQVSPKKTWEGAIGGAVLGTLGASLAAGLLMDGLWWVGAAVGLACVVAAVLGDLAESALKRDIAIKDMSNAIPGHGGVLDRVDSLLPAAAAAYTVFALLIGSR